MNRAIGYDILKEARQQKKCLLKVRKLVLSLLTYAEAYTSEPRHNSVINYNNWIGHKHFIFNLTKIGEKTASIIISHLVVPWDGLLFIWKNV